MPGGDAKLPSDHGIDAASEDRFFHDRSHENSQAHEHQHALAAAEKLFHGNSGVAPNKISEPSHHHGQSETAQNIAHDGRARGHAAESAPTHGLPKRRGATPPNHGIQKCQSSPGKEGLGDNQYGRAGGSGFLQDGWGNSKEHESARSNNQGKQTAAHEIKEDEIGQIDPAKRCARIGRRYMILKRLRLKFRPGDKYGYMLGRNGFGRRHGPLLFMLGYRRHVIGVRGVHSGYAASWMISQR